MAVNFLDDLNEVLGVTAGPGLNERELAWLWMFIKKDGADLDPGLYGSQTARNQIATWLKHRPHLRNQARELMKSHFLPDRTLSWITNDSRLLAWLDAQLHLPEPPPQLYGRQRLMAKIDSWDLSPTDKLGSLQTLEKIWINLRHLDHLFAWFNDGDQTKCATAWELVRDTQPLSMTSVAPFRNYSDMMLFFDKSKWDEAKKTLYVIKIKRRWSQQAYRNRHPTKKQYNFVLSNDTNQRLNELAAKYNLKRNQILDILIKGESDGELYIPEHMRARSSLL
jgi:hypothetical protein